LLGVLSAKQMGSERIVAMSRHEKRQQRNVARVLATREKWQWDLNRVNAYLIDNCGYPNANATHEPNLLNLKTSVKQVKSQNLEIKSGRQDGY
jgi:hypothetical protein